MLKQNNRKSEPGDRIEPTIEQRLRKCRRKLRTVTVVLVIFVIITAVYIYMNYDYLVFKHFLTGFYIHTDTLDEFLENETGRDAEGRYYAYFDDAVISVVTKSLRELNNDRYTYLYLPDQYQKQRESERIDALNSEFRPINDKTVYMRLTNFSDQARKLVYDNLPLLQGYDSIIIDLRNNYGGDINIMKDITGLFLERGDIIATDRTRFGDRVLKAGGERSLAYDRIVILQGGNTASAAENMIGALKCNLPDVILIGEKTFGKGIGQYTIPLKHRFAVKATVLFWDLPNGINIHGKGIAPDIPYTGDDIISFAADAVVSDNIWTD